MCEPIEIKNTSGKTIGYRVVRHSSKNEGVITRVMTIQPNKTVEIHSRRNESVEILIESIA